MDNIDDAIQSAHKALAESFKVNSDIEYMRHCLRQAVVSLLADCDAIKRSRHVSEYQTMIKPIIPC